MVTREQKKFILLANVYWNTIYLNTEPRIIELQKSASDSKVLHNTVCNAAWFQVHMAPPSHLIFMVVF